MAAELTDHVGYEKHDTAGHKRPPVRGPISFGMTGHTNPSTLFVQTISIVWRDLRARVALRITLHRQTNCRDEYDVSRHVSDDG